MPQLKTHLFLTTFHLNLQALGKTWGLRKRRNGILTTWGNPQRSDHYWLGGYPRKVYIKGLCTHDWVLTYVYLYIYIYMYVYICTLRYRIWTYFTLYIYIFSYGSISRAVSVQFFLHFFQRCMPRLFCPYKHLPDSLLDVQSPYQNPQKTNNNNKKNKALKDMYGSSWLGIL